MNPPIRAASVRLADPDRDANPVAAIYRPSVESGLASFEEKVPTVPAMASRMRATLRRTPWLVAEDGDAVIGFAYAGPHRERAGYRWSVNVSVYVAEGRQGQGIGRGLYDALMDILRRQRFVNAYAGITLPNPASEALHRSIGMEQVGVYRRVGTSTAPGTTWPGSGCAWRNLTAPRPNRLRCRCSTMDAAARRA